MNAEDVLALVKAGYTKDEIAAFNSATEPATETPKEEPVAVETPKEPEQVKKNSDGESGLDVESFKAGIMADVTKMIQANNRQQVVIDTPKPQTTDDIFASVFGMETDK